MRAVVDSHLSSICMGWKHDHVRRAKGNKSVLATLPCPLSVIVLCELRLFAANSDELLLTNTVEHSDAHTHDTPRLVPCAGHNLRSCHDVVASLLRTYKHDQVLAHCLS